MTSTEIKTHVLLGISDSHESRHGQHNVWLFQKLFLFYHPTVMFFVDIFRQRNVSQLNVSILNKFTRSCSVSWQ